MAAAARTAPATTAKPHRTAAAKIAERHAQENRHHRPDLTPAEINNRRMLMLAMLAFITDGIAELERHLPPNLQTPKPTPSLPWPTCNIVTNTGPLETPPTAAPPIPLAPSPPTAAASGVTLTTPPQPQPLQLTPAAA